MQLIVNASFLLNDWPQYCSSSISRLLSQQHSSKYDHSFLMIFSSRIHTFSLSRISPVRYRSCDFTYELILYFAWQTLPLRFLRHNFICQKHSKPRRHRRSVRCSPTTAPQCLSPFIVSLEKYLATDLHSFTCPACLALPEVLLTLVRGLFQTNKIQHHSRIHHKSPKTMHLYDYIKRKCLSFL